MTRLFSIATNRSVNDANLQQQIEQLKILGWRETLCPILSVRCRNQVGIHPTASSTNHFASQPAGTVHIRVHLTCM